MISALASGDSEICIAPELDLERATWPDVAIVPRPTALFRLVFVWSLQSQT
jgi:hypothetical protein